MAIYGTRNGVFTVKNLQYDTNFKRLNIDRYNNVMSSATIIMASAAMLSTASNTLGTQLDTPRAIEFVNGMILPAERKIKVVTKGYDAQGAYQEESLTLSSASTGITKGNIPFAYISEIVPLTSTKGYGTYGTVEAILTDKFGVSQYVESQGDILTVGYHGGDDSSLFTSSTGIVTSTTFSRTYQTLDLTSNAPTGSTLQLVYRTIGQKKLD